MADNFQISTVDGNKTIGTDQISSVDYQRVKLIHGAKDVYDDDAGKYAAAGNTTALPVTNYPASDFMSIAGAAVSPVMTYNSHTTDSDIIASVSGKKIRVLALCIIKTTAGDDMNFRDGTVSATILWSTLNLAVAVLHVLPFCPMGWFETTSGNSLFGDITGSGPTIVQTVHIAV